MANFDINIFFNNPKQNMYIDASAGTGKTYTIQQIVAVLVENKIPLDKILIVTYTDKAAGELRDRIRSKIYEVIQKGDVIAQVKSQNLNFFKDQVKMVDNAPIFTIHSFCQRTLDEFAFDASRPYSMALIDEGESSAFVDKWIRDEIDQDPDFNDLCNRTGMSAAEIKLDSDLFIKIKEGLNKYYPKVKQFDDLFQAKTKKESNVNNVYHLLSLSDSNYSDKSNSDKKKEHDEILGRRFNKNVYSETFIGNKNSFYKEQFIKKKVDELYPRWQDEKLKRKVQSYDDMISCVRESVLANNSDLLDHLKNKYCFAIIDEFQDTNQLEWDIFKTVFLNQPDHNICVVGDPKQSIYAFQGADVNVYKNAVKEISNQGGTGYVLVTNYRSTNEIVEACNALFDGTFFDKNSNILKFSGSKACGKFKSSEYCGNTTKPIWIADQPNDTNEYAQIVAEQIIECCSLNNGKKTNLQIYDRDSQVSRNVTFGDFAVLARTSWDMPAFEKAFKKFGIPFKRYKDKNLFSGVECRCWIALFKAIDATDFTDRNRMILNEALMSPFFNVQWDSVNDCKFDDPACDERTKIDNWRKCMQDRKWAKMFDKIYEDSKVEQNFASYSKLQSLGKLRQIGRYSLNYLNEHNCSLSELIKHLLLHNVIVEDEGSIVEINTDMKCVNLMTIHASKGLEFPVVIVAGNVPGNPKTNNVNTYHDNNNGSIYINCGHYGKTKNQEESRQEIERLFYVAYTRARSLMILSQNSKGVEDFVSKDANTSYYEKITLSQYTIQDFQNKVKLILNNNIVSEDFDAQKNEIKKLSDSIYWKRIMKHSYSSLSHSSHSGESQDENRVSSPILTDESGKPLDKEVEITNSESLAEFDNNGVLWYDFGHLDISKTPVSATYPKGAKLGSALHEVFEFYDFSKIDKTVDQALVNEDLKTLIKSRMRGQGMKVEDNDAKGWIAQSVDFVWNTLHAKLPVIVGSKITDNSFIVKDGAAEHKAEVEFNMLNEDSFHHFCTGSIDLLFRHEVDGNPVYSIADWKSDSLEPELYGDANAIKSHVDAKYSIQRVLYSYSLIKWLKQFYNKPEKEIFEKHFGGVYYIFLRATENQSFAGTYSQTWESWDALESAYEKIRESLICKSSDK